METGCVLNIAALWAAAFLLLFLLCSAPVAGSKTNHYGTGLARYGADTAVQGGGDLAREEEAPSMLTERRSYEDAAEQRESNILRRRKQLGPSTSVMSNTGFAKGSSAKRPRKTAFKLLAGVAFAFVAALALWRAANVAFMCLMQPTAPASESARSAAHRRLLSDPEAEMDEVIEQCQHLVVAEMKKPLSVTVDEVKGGFGSEQKASVLKRFMNASWPVTALAVFGSVLLLVALALFIYGAVGEGGPVYGGKSGHHDTFAQVLSRMERQRRKDYVARRPTIPRI